MNVTQRRRKEAAGLTGKEGCPRDPARQRRAATPVPREPAFLTRRPGSPAGYPAGLPQIRT